MFSRFSGEHEADVEVELETRATGTVRLLRARLKNAKSVCSTGYLKMN